MEPDYLTDIKKKQAEKLIEKIKNTSIGKAKPEDLSGVFFKIGSKIIEKKKEGKAEKEAVGEAVREVKKDELNKSETENK